MMTRKLLVVFLATICALHCERQSAAQSAPPPTHQDVKYGRWDRNVLDLWMPESDQPTPLLVFIHGGGFTGGSKEKVRQTDQVRQALDRRVAFASIEYRFRYPDDGEMSDPQRTGIQNILRDSARAIQYLRHHADRYNLDPARIACYGGSAGAGTSIWLAFHDDLADPQADDPVLRQSSRISAAGMLAGQFSYDLQQWDKAFSEVGGSLVRTHGRNGKLQLHRFYGLNEDLYRGSEGEAVRADVDMHGLISADDPPVFIQTNGPAQPPTTRGIYNHHPLHAQLIEQRCKECGVDVLCLLPKVNPQDALRLKDNPNLMMDFFFAQLQAPKRDETAAETLIDEKSATVTALPKADPESVGMDPKSLAQIHPALKRFVSDEKIAGAVVAVAREGKMVMLEAVGMQDAESQVPMETDTIFRIYSMTKPVTSVAAMMLVEQGHLKLDDPVAKYIPEFADARVFVSKEDGNVTTEPLNHAVTIRDLMRHTSGLTYGFFGNSPVDQMYREAEVLSDSDDSEALAKKVAAIPLMYQPGTKFQYGVSVDVLGRVIEVVRGQSLEQFMDEKIFTPLKMDDTGFFVADVAHARLATAYSPQVGGGLDVSDDPRNSRFLKRPKMFSGGGGLVSTASDYLRFAQMILNGGELDGVRILSSESVQTMTTNQLPSKAIPIQVGGFPMFGVGFGLGFSVIVEAKIPGQVVGEYGWDGMASTHYWASKEEELAVVVMTQHIPYTNQLKNTIKPIVYESIMAQ